MNKKLILVNFKKMKCRDISQIDITPSFSPNKKYTKLKNIVGFDTETEKGKCFLIGFKAINEHNILFIDEPKELFKFLSLKKFRNTFNFFYNITYDFQAIIKTLPYNNIEEIAKRNHTKYINYKIKYIPNKLFSINRNKYYDLAQFFNFMSLDKAGSKFLNINKLNLKENMIDISNLSSEEYKNNINYQQILKKYLSQDCNITYQLAIKMYELIKPYMFPKGFYSQAYFSQQYFLENITKTFTLPKNEILQYSLNSYQGGRFETLKRGFFEKSYLADIKSAYPFHNSLVPDVSKGKWKKEKEFDDNALVSLFKINVEVNDLDISPLKYQLKDNLLLYPLGKIKEMYVNKEEFKILNKYSSKIKVLDVWNYYDKEPEYPYTFLESLFEYKEKLKKEGKETESWIPKIFMNGFYGKMIQIIKQYYYSKEHDINNESNLVDIILYKNNYIYQYQKFKAGRIFNPIVANEITANTRCQLFNSAIKHQKHIIGFQTDSIITDKKITLDEGNKLGQWEYEKENKELVILGTGVYQVLDKDEPKRRLRGFSKDLDLYSILKENPTQEDYSLNLKRNYKLKKTLKLKFDKQKNILTDKQKYDKFNLIEYEPRLININFDRKRVWDRNFINFNDVLNSKINSKPINV